MKDDVRDLRREMADRITGPFAWFLKIEAASGLLLLLGTVAALGVAKLLGAV